MPTHTLHFAALRKRQGYGHPIWRFSKKMGGRQLAEGLGIRVPELYAGPEHVTKIPDPGFGVVVLKPVDGCASRGVLPAVSEEGGFWRSLWGDGTKTWHEWQDWSVRQRERSRGGPCPQTLGQWYVEEMVGGTVPYDWKVYLIHGQVAFIRQHLKYDRPVHAAKVKCWTPEWKPAGRVILQEKPEDDSLPAPEHGTAILEQAQRIAKELPTPFVRIDFYEDAKGPVFGEITPHPAAGKQRYAPEWDMKLGKMWRA